MLFELLEAFQELQRWVWYLRSVQGVGGTAHTKSRRILSKSGRNLHENDFSPNETLCYGRYLSLSCDDDVGTEMMRVKANGRVLFACLAFVFGAVGGTADADVCSKAGLVDLGTVKAVRGQTVRYMRFTERKVVFVTTTGPAATRIEADYSVSHDSVTYRLTKATGSAKAGVQTLLAEDMEEELPLRNPGPHTVPCELTGNSLRFGTRDVVYDPSDREIDALAAVWPLDDAEGVCGLPGHTRVVATWRSKDGTWRSAPRVYSYETGDQAREALEGWWSIPVPLSPHCVYLNAGEDQHYAEVRVYRTQEQTTEDRSFSATELKKDWRWGALANSDFERR